MSATAPLTVAHFTRDFPPRSAGGISTAVGGLVAALERRGVVNVVFSFDGWRPRASVAATPAAPAEWTNGGSEIVRSWAPSGLEQVSARLRSAPTSILHAHDPLLWGPMCQAAATLRCPRIYTVHVAHAEIHRLRGLTTPTLSLEAERAALEAADIVTAPSRAAAAACSSATATAGVRRDPAAHPVDDGGCSRGQRPDIGGIVVCPLGVDDDQHAREASTRRASAAGPVEGTVLSLGRFGDVKGSSEWIAAISEIARRRPDTDFVVAGGLPHNRRAHERWVREFRSASPRVTAPGWLDPAARERALAEAAMLVLPSRFETFALVAAEAALRATPIVATRCGGPEEFLRHDQSALLTAPGDPMALADSVVTLLDDPLRAAALGREAARIARREWTWERRIDRWIDVYSRCL